MSGTLGWRFGWLAKVDVLNGWVEGVCRNFTVFPATEVELLGENTKQGGNGWVAGVCRKFNCFLDTEVELLGENTKQGGK